MQEVTGSTKTGETEERECPQCGASIPVQEGYVTWCDACGWNLQPVAPEAPLGMFASVYASMGRRLSQALFRELANAKPQTLRPRVTPAKLLAFTMAMLVHAFTAFFAVAAVLLLIRGWPNILAILGSLLCAAIAWVLRPRLSRLTGDPVSRDRFPTLYKITRDLAKSLGTSNVDYIIVNEEFNAAFDQVGWRRKKALYIGLPLFSILDAGERVAILGHELAHGVNGDPTRGAIIGSAIDSLVMWHLILHPGVIWDPDNPEGGFLSVPGNLLRAGLAAVVAAWFYTLVHLVYRDSQRAEYLADYLAARTGGTSATIAALSKLYFAGAFYTTLQRVSLNWNNQDLFEEFRKQVAAMPAREVERLSRIRQLTGSRLDVTHPPTGYRIEFLRAHPVENPKVVISPREFDAMEGEFETVREEIQTRLLDQHRDMMYY